ncbi:MAG: choice-of-anchor tandem repeat GloVer-containing protein [Candidatus Sulfotelmatobacter sp.]
MPFVGNAGSIFELSSNGVLTTLYTFCSQNDCTDGSDPVTGMLQGTDGILYGTTAYGGTNNDGVVYSLSVGLGPFVETTPIFGKVGARVTILGNNLEGATRVTFNSADAAITSGTNTEITTTVPTGATTGAVEVMTAAGTKLESNVVFQVIP